MHTRKIFAVLSLVALAATTTAFSFQHLMPDMMGSFESAPNVAGGEVFTHVTSQLSALNKKVHTRMPAGEKVMLLRKTLSDIKAMREASPIERVDKEVEMDFATDALEPIAMDPNFSVHKCDIYKAKMIVNFEPYANPQEGPSNPPLHRAFEIMQGICG